MKKNIGHIDRLLRLVIALALFSLYFMLEGDLRYLALIGLVPLTTALIRFCPAYCIIGINTDDKSCKEGQSTSDEGKKNKDNNSPCCGSCGGSGHNSSDDSE